MNNVILTEREIGFVLADLERIKGELQKFEDAKRIAEETLNTCEKVDAYDGEKKYPSQVAERQELIDTFNCRINEAKEAIKYYENLLKSAATQRDKMKIPNNEKIQVSFSFEELEAITACLTTAVLDGFVEDDNDPIITVLNKIEEIKALAHVK